MTLEDAVRAGDVERALSEAGALALREDGLETLAEQWICILALVAGRMDVVGGTEGAGGGTGAGAAYAETQRDILALVEDLEEDAERVRARHIFLGTTKLVLLWQRCRGKPDGTTSGAPHISRLRERVMGHFPEGAGLSDRGMERFAGIVRSAEGAGEAEKALVVRVIAGLCRLYSSGGGAELRAALEYLSRRRLALFDGESDYLVGTLWEVLLRLDEENPARFVTAAHRLYGYRLKKKDRVGRRPLLWACAAAPAARGAALSAASPWGPEEEQLLRLVATKTPDLWKQLRTLHRGVGGAGGAGGDGAEEAERRAEQIRLLMSYMPRAKGSGGGEEHREHRAGDSGAAAAPPRTFHLTEGRGQGPARDIRPAVKVLRRGGEGR